MKWAYIFQMVIFKNRRMLVKPSLNEVTFIEISRPRLITVLIRRRRFDICDNLNLPYIYIAYIKIMIKPK